MKSKNKLSQKEELFCLYYLKSRDARLAAANAGYSTSPERTSQKLLQKKSIKDRLSLLQKERNASLGEITDGYRRLAFGSIADAISLIFLEEAPTKEEIERLDLSMVSDIKRPKGGGLEIKFFDRLKALDRLCEIGTAAESESSSDFLSALEKSARALHSDGEELE